MLLSLTLEEARYASSHFLCRHFNIKLACQDRVTLAKFFHVVFFLVFKGIFQFFGAKCRYSLRYWEL